MKKNYLIFAMLFTVLLNVPNAFSAALEGTVVSVTPGIMIVNVGGGNRQAEIKMEHITELGYFDTLQDLELGDWVHISYWRKNGHMMAASIIKEENGPDEF